MRQRTRDDDHDVTPVPVPPGGEGGEQAALHERAAALLAAADDAISRALSHDSTEFLAQNRQMGGE